jgi:hypothetical protein
VNHRISHVGPFDYAIRYASILEAKAPDALPGSLENATPSDVLERKSVCCADGSALEQSGSTRLAGWPHYV